MYRLDTGFELVQRTCWSGSDRIHSISCFGGKCEDEAVSVKYHNQCSSTASDERVPQDLGCIWCWFGQIDGCRIKTPPFDAFRFPVNSPSAAWTRTGRRLHFWMASFLLMGGVSWMSWAILYSQLSECLADIGRFLQMRGSSAGRLQWHYRLHLPKLQLLGSDWCF